MAKTFRQYVNEGGTDAAIYNKWLQDIKAAEESYSTYAGEAGTKYNKQGSAYKRNLDELRKRGAKIREMTTTGEMSVVSVGTIDGVLSRIDKIQSGVDEVEKFYSQFENEDKFYDWSFSKKYNGKRVADIDSAIKSVGDKRETEWLTANRDSFLSTDEILKEIEALEKQSHDISRNKWAQMANYLGNPTSEQLAVTNAGRDAAYANEARLNKLYNLVASREDFDAEAAYKQLDERNLSDIFADGHTIADQRNEQAKKNIYGNAVLSQRQAKDLKIIEADAELKKDLETYFGADASAGMAGGGNIKYNINKKYKNSEYDFERLYESYKRQRNAENTEALQGNEALQGKIADFTEKNEILANVGALVTNVLGSASGIADTVYTKAKDLFSDDIVALDVNSPAWALKNTTDTIRDTTSRIITENNEGIKGEFKNFLYQTGISIADMGTAFLASGFNPTVYPLIMSSNAAADKIKSVTENGGSIDEALVSGFVSGALEAVFEKIGIDKLVENITTSAGKSVMKTFFNGFLSEGLEELGTDIANSVTDAIINGNQSEFKYAVYNYMEDGDSESKAWAKAVTDTAKQYMTSFAGGALSGGFLGGVGGSIGKAIQTRENAKLGKETLAEGSADYLMGFAKAQAEAQKSEELNAAIAKVEKQQSKSADKIYKSTSKEAITAAVKDRLRVLGMNDADISNAAQEITDAHLKNRGLRKFSDNTIAGRVLSELRATNTDGGFTNDWALEMKNSLQAAAAEKASKEYRARDIGAVRRALAGVTPEYEQTHSTFRTDKNLSDREKVMGAATDVNTNKNVTVSKVLEKADGGFVVQLTNGTKGFVATREGAQSEYSEIRMKNTDANHLAMVASSLETPESMNAFIKAFGEGQDVIAYSKEFKEAYNMGLDGRDYSGSQFGMLTEDQSRLAYNSGVTDSALTYRAAVEKTADIFNSVKNQNYSAGVTRIDDTEVNNSRRMKAQLAVLDAFGKKHNLSFIITDEIETEKGTANGVYLGENKFMISAKAEAGAILSVAGHEVYHYLEKHNSDAATAIRAFVLEKLANNANFDLEGRRAELSYAYGADTDIDAEIVANSMFDVLSNEKTINELAEENPSLLKRLLAEIKQFISDIKNIIAQLGNSWAEVKALSEDLQTLEQIRWLMEAALEGVEVKSETSSSKLNENEEKINESEEKVNENVNNSRKSEIKNTADEDSVKYNLKRNQIYAGMPDSERAEILKNSAINIAQYSGNEELNGKNVLMLKSTYRKKAREILIELSEKFQIFDSKYLNENIELAFEYSRNSLKESVNKQGDISTDFYDFAKMLYIFDDVIKNAVPIEVHTDKYEGTKRANPNLKYDYVLLSAFSDGEYIIPVEFHIKEFKENVKEPNKLYVSITLGKIKIENKVIAQVAENYMNNNQWQSALLFSEISIPQLIEKINPEYGNFYKYIPSELLDDEQIKSKKIAVDDEEYKLKVMRGEDVSDILSRKASEKGYDTDTSWRMDHKAPNAKYDVCITDIDKCYGGDGSIYSPKAAYYYGDGRSYDQKAINAIKKARKSPETLISIYRAVPDNIKDTRVRNGDWVSIDKEYAEEHGWRMFDDDYRIIENKVPAKYLFTDGNSIHEFGYDNGNSNEVYKNTENNVKLNEVTYDDRGNIIPLSKRFDESKPDIRYSYASKKARNSNLTKFAEAVRLESEGLSSEEIRQKTGWFRGYDNKWRFEIDDSKMKVSTSGLYSRNPDVRRFQELLNKIYFEENATDEERKEFKHLDDSLEGVQMKPRLLGDLIDHEELFAAYPQLQDVFITYKENTGIADGWFDPITNEIVFNQSAVLRPDRLKEILIHEIQHAIQHIEELTEGASPDLYEYDKYAKYETLSQRKLAEAERKLNEQMSMSREDISSIVSQYNSETMYEEMTDSEYAKAYDRAAAQIKDEYLQEAFWDYSVARERAYKELAAIEKDTPMDSYRKTAGEIEARDVSKRLGYDAEKRKNTRPDIDRTDVVFAEGGLSYSEEEPEIKLSLQKTSDAEKVRDNLIKQNKNLRVANMILKQELVQTNGNMLSYKDAAAIAKDIVKTFSSSYDIEALAEDIYNSFKWYDGADASYDQLINHFVSLGEKVVGESSALDTTLYDDYADARNWIRNMEFALPEHVLRQLNENYSGRFAAQTFGRMKYVSKSTHPDAPYLSAIYSELASEYPNFFSEEDNEYEQPQKLIDFWNKIKPTYGNGYSELGFASVEDAAVGFAYELFNSYMNNQKLETFADKQRKERERLHKEYSDNLERMRDAERRKRDKKLEEQKEYYIGIRKKSAADRRKTLTKRKIKNVIKELEKYLNRGSKRANVKDDMQETVTSAISSAQLLFSESYSNEDIIRAGIENSPVLSSATDREEIWIAEYAELIKKKDKANEEYAATGDMTMSDESIALRENLEELIAGYEKRQKYLDEQLGELFDRERRRLDKTSVNEVLTKLAAAYKSLEKSELNYISNAYDAKLYDYIIGIRDDLGGAKVSQMDLLQLEKLYDAYKIVLHTVRNSNKLFTEERNADVETLALDAMNEIRKAGSYRDKNNVVVKFLSKFGWGELKPVYAFRTIGSDILSERYKALRKGEDTFWRDIEHSRSFSEEQKKKHNYSSWDFKEKYTFKSKADEEFTLTLQQIMSLYAYTRRGEQAVEHIIRGGIVHSDNIKENRSKKTGQILSYEVPKEAYSIAPETLGSILHVLTDEQRRYVEDMQAYLTNVMGDKGNEVSKKMFGVKLFNEKIYFPLKTSQYYRNFNGEQEGEVLLKNAGFTKAVTPHAKNAIVLDDFVNVWSQHVNDMAQYHSFTLPIEDLMRIYNYRGMLTEETTKQDSFKSTLNVAFGDEANKYIETFLRDVNGGTKSADNVAGVGKMISLSKKAAVFASLSVVVQQPSAVLRAAAIVDPKHFAQALPKSINWATVKKQYEELKKYAPVAGIKEMGYFDTGIGRTASEWIMADEYEGIGNKISGFLKDGKYRDEVISFLPSKADEISWVYIWNAVKRETAETGNYLTEEEMLNAAGERFTEVIELTQVYDSVFSRSQLMRNKDNLVKMATSFMAEPTVQINMLADGIIQGKRKKNKKYTGRIFAAVYASILANAVLKSIVTAARDDDEDMNYAEKYIGNLLGSFLQDGMLLSSIPFVRDAVSIMQGYDVERMDMTVISDFVSAITALGNENKSVWDKISNFAGATASLFGIPLKNIIRDIKALKNSFETALKGYKFSGSAAKEAITRNVLGKNTSKGDLLYKAVIAGDAEFEERIRALYDDEDSVNNALRTALRKHDERITDAAQARLDGKLDVYYSIAKKIVDEGKFSQDNIVTAINSQVEAMKEEEDEPSEKKKKGYFTDDDYFASVVCGDGATAKIIAEDVISTDVANGKTREDAEENLVKAFVNNVKEYFLNGAIDEQDAEQYLQNVAGMSASDAKNKLSFWLFDAENPDIGISEETIAKYNNVIKSSGISMDVYVEYYIKQKNCKADVDKNGKSISGSKKKKVIAIINSMPITNAQKDFLYLQDYAKSTLDETPWN